MNRCRGRSSSICDSSGSTMSGKPQSLDRAEVSTAELVALLRRQTDLSDRLLEGVEYQVVHLLFDLSQPGSHVGGGSQPAAELVLAETDVTALVLDDALEDIRGHRVGIAGVTLEHGELQRFEDDILGENCGFPVPAA